VTSLLRRHSHDGLITLVI